MDNTILGLKYLIAGWVAFVTIHSGIFYLPTMLFTEKALEPFGPLALLVDIGICIAAVGLIVNGMSVMIHRWYSSPGGIILFVLQVILMLILWVAIAIPTMHW